MGGVDEGMTYDGYVTDGEDSGSNMYDVLDRMEFGSGLAL